MKRFDDVLERQKNGLVLDLALAIVLLVAIGLAAMGVAKTLSATTGWTEPTQLVITASVADVSAQSAPIG